KGFLFTANISTRASARMSDHQVGWSLGKTSFETCPKPTSRRSLIRDSSVSQIERSFFSEAVGERSFESWLVSGANSRNSRPVYVFLLTLNCRSGDRSGLQPFPIDFG